MRPAAIMLALVAAGATPVPPKRITWIQPNTSATKAQSYTYTLSLIEEGKPPRDIPLVGVLCGGLSINTECMVALPAEAQAAMITGNISRVIALDPAFPKAPSTSDPFTGNQGCLFRSLLYAINERGTAVTNKQNLNAVLAEFKAAKFQHISTTPLPKGNQFQVLEQCVGYIVP